MSYSDRKEGNWDYQRVSGQLKAQEKAQKEAIKAAEKAQKKAAKSSRRSSYSAPKNLTVDQVMADYNSWNAKQPQTAEQVMADFNAWNTDADAWMKSQTPVQTSTQGSSRRVVPMDTFTPFNQGKQDKQEEQGATRIHFDATKQERPDPTAITKGKEIPQLEITDPSSAYNKVVEYKEELRKIDKEKERQQELREKNKAIRLEKQAERAEKAKERKDWTNVVPELKKDYGTGIMGIGREYADQVNKLQKSAYGDKTDRELAELKKEYDSNTHFGLKTDEQRLLDREIDQRKKAKKEAKYGTGLKAIWNESLDNAEKNYAQRVEDYQKAVREYQKVSALTDPSAMYRETPEQRAERNDAMLNLYAAANGYSLEGAKEDLQEQNDKALVQQWLDPSYKMSDDERARATQIIEKYWDDPEWNQDDLSKLSAKENAFVSGATAFAKPIYNAAHFVGNVVDDVVGTGLEMGAGMLDALPFVDGLEQSVRNARADYQNMTGDWANQMDTAAENAATQHPIASGVGNFAGQAAMYALTNPAFDAIAGVGNLGLAGTAALEQAGQNLQDLLLDTLPEYERNIRNGMSQDEAIRQAFETQGYNALGNLAIPIIGDLLSGGKKAITNYFKNANTPDPEFLSELRKYRQNVLDPLAADADNIAKAARTTDLSPLETAAKNVDVDNLATAGRQTVNNLDELAEQAAKTDVAKNGLRYPEQDNPIIDSIETARKGMEEGIPKATSQLDTHQMQVDNVLSKYDFNANEETKVLVDSVQNDYKAYKEAIQIGDTEAADATAKKLRSDLGKLHRLAEKYVPDYNGELNVRDITQGSNYPAYSIRNIKNAKIDADSVMNNWNNSFLASEFGEMTQEQYDAFLKEAQDLGWVDELGNPTKEALGSIPSSEYDDILSQYDDIVKNALEQGNTERDTAASILDSLEKEQKAGRVYLDDKEWYDMVGAANEYARTGEKQYLDQMNDIVSAKHTAEPPRKLSYEGDNAATSALRTNTAEKSGMLKGHEEQFPVEDFGYNRSTEELQRLVSEERYRGSTDLAGDLIRKQNYDAADVKASMDEWNRLLASGTDEDIAKAQRLSRKISYEGREGGRVVQAFAEYSRDPGTAGLNQAQTMYNRALDAKYGVGTSEAINNLSMQIDEALEGMDFKDVDSLSAVLTELLDKELKAYAPNNKALQKDMATRYIRGKQKILSGVKKGKYTSADEIIADLCKQNHVYNLSGIDQKKVYDLLTEASKYAPGSYEQEALLAEAGKIARKNVPSTLGAKARSILYMNMLGNFKTAVSRNFFGNVAYQTLEGTRQPIAAFIDRVVARKTGKHSTTGWSRAKWKEYREGFKKGMAEQLKDIKRKIHTGRSGELGWDNALKNNASTWGDKGLAKLANNVEYYVTAAMQLGDRGFFEANYAQNLYELKTLVKKYGQDGVAGLSGVPAELLDDTMDTIAAVRAADSVFQKHGNMSKGLTNIRNGLGEMSKGTIGTDILSTASTPFTMTPGNMLERAIEYTPFGLVKNGVETAIERSKGTFDQRRFVDELSRTVTGVPLLAGGAALASEGLINGGYSTDPDEKRAQVDDGFTEYGFNIPDEVPLVGGRTLDTSDLPVIGPFMQAGSAIAENGLSGALQAGEAVLGGAATQGLRRVMGADSGSMGYSSNDSIANNIINTLGSAGGQLVPSLLRQTAQFSDKYKRDLGEYGTLEYYLNGVKNAVPGLRQTLPIKYDTEGNPVLQNQGRGVVDKALESYLLPMNVSEYEQSELNEEALRLKENTSTHTAMGFAPRANRGDLRAEFEKDNVPGEYSEDIYREYSRNLGTLNSQLGNALIDSDWYGSLGDDEKAKALSEVYSVAKHVAIRKATGQEIEDKNARIFDEGGAELLFDYMKTRDDANYKTESGATTSSTYSKVNALADLPDESLDELLPEFLDLTKDNGEPNTKGLIYDQYGARTLIDFYQNGYEVTGTNELPKTESDATKAALMFPKNMQEDMLHYYLSQQSKVIPSKLSNAEQEVLASQGVSGLQKYVEQEDTLHKYGSYSYDEKAQKIYQDGGIPALEKYGQTRQALEQAGAKSGKAYDAYEHARGVDPSITPKKFAAQYNYIDSLGNGDGDISQKEIIAAMNARPNDAQAIEALYWTSEKTIPVLKNGKWTTKKVKKKK